MLALTVAAALALAPIGRVGVGHHGIPAFARKYRTACSTCHTAPPKLNVLGEAFRLNGYRFPDNDALLRKDEPLSLGQEPWKALWPRAVWPSSLPETVPLAVRIINDIARERSAQGSTRVDFRFPNEIYLLGAATFDDQFSTFLETEWTEEDGVEVEQAKVIVTNPIPGIPDRLVSVTAGLQNLYLFTFADRQIDRAARQPFRWQLFSPQAIALAGPGAGTIFRAGSDFRLQQPQPALEVSGLLGSHAAYGIGVAQGTEHTRDDNTAKDVYYRLRYKVGGLGLDGRYRRGKGPVIGGGGQLQDHAVILEHFGYFGTQPNDADRNDRLRSFGVAARMLHGPADLGVGFVWGRRSHPWNLGSGRLTFRSVSAKAEVQVYPWLFGSIKAEWLDVTLPSSAGNGLTPVPADLTTLTPGLVALIRQNVRWVLESEFFPRHAESSRLGTRRPHGAWMRFELAF